MIDDIKWHWREVQRIWRLLRPERSARLLIQTVGPWWLLWHGARREYKVKLFKGGAGWYCIDIALPRYKAALEAKGGWRKYYDGDIVRDQRLSEKGWRVLRISEAEMLKDPKASRRKVRRFVIR